MEGRANHSSMLATRTLNNVKKQKDMTPEDEFPSSEGVKLKDAFFLD